MRWPGKWKKGFGDLNDVPVLRGLRWREWGSHRHLWVMTLGQGGEYFYSHFSTLHDDLVGFKKKGSWNLAHIHALHWFHTQCGTFEMRTFVSAPPFLALLRLRAFNDAPLLEIRPNLFMCFRKPRVACLVLVSLVLSDTHLLCPCFLSSLHCPSVHLSISHRFLPLSCPRQIPSSSSGLQVFCSLAFSSWYLSGGCIPEGSRWLPWGWHTQNQPIRTRHTSSTLLSCLWFCG